IKLESAVKNTGASYDDFSKRVGATDAKMQTFGHGTADTETALSKLTVRLGDPSKALADMGVVAEVAASKNISLSAAADIVGKAAQGNTKILKQYGISLTDTKKLTDEATAADKAVVTTQDALSTATQKLSDLKAIQAGKTKLTIADQFALRDATNAVKAAQDAHTAAIAKASSAHDALNAASKNAKDGVTQLGDKLKGIAEGEASTFHGKMDALKVKLQDFAGSIGQKVGPALVTLGPLMMGLGPIMTSLQSGFLKTGAEAIWSGLKMAGSFVAAAAQAVVSGAVMLAQLVWTGLKWLWAGAQAMAGAVMMAASWLIAMGPIVLVVAAVIAVAVLIWKNWDTIKQWTITIF